jgi:tetratricopeptide (TPR) repeat protein
LGQIEDVEAAVASASSIAPNQHGILVLEGDLFLAAGFNEKAVISYYKALSIGLGKKDYNVWWKLARSSFLIKRYTEAADAYEKTLELYRDPLDAYKKSSNLYRDPPLDDYLICHEYGITLEKLNRSRESIHLYGTSLCLQPNHRIASYNRKQVYKRIYYEKR